MNEEEKLRERVRKAMDKYTRRQQAKPARLSRKNAKPEQELVTKLLAHLRAHGWSVHCVEAKAVFSAQAGRYLRGQTVPGFPDIVGNMPDGHACFIEVKAPGKRSTLRDDQRGFLLDKIATNAFAAVVDSIELLETLTIEWKKSHSRKATLMRALPPPKQTPSDDDIFGEP